MNTEDDIENLFDGRRTAVYKYNKYIIKITRGKNISSGKETLQRLSHIKELRPYLPLFVQDDERIIKEFKSKIPNVSGIDTKKFLVFEDEDATDLIIFCNKFAEDIFGDRYDLKYNTYLKWMYELIKEVKIMHKHRIYHYDLKLDNVLITNVHSGDISKMKIKIIDFPDEETGKKRRDPASHMATFNPPEFYESYINGVGNEPIQLALHPPADIFCLGLMFAYWLTTRYESMLDDTKKVVKGKGVYKKSKRTRNHEMTYFEYKGPIVSKIDLEEDVDGFNDCSDDTKNKLNILLTKIVPLMICPDENKRITAKQLQTVFKYLLEKNEEHKYLKQHEDVINEVIEDNETPLDKKEFHDLLGKCKTLSDLQDLIDRYQDPRWLHEIFSYYIYFANELQPELLKEYKNVFEFLKRKGADIKNWIGNESYFLEYAINGIKNESISEFYGSISLWLIQNGSNLQGALYEICNEVKKQVNEPNPMVKNIINALLKKGATVANETEIGSPLALLSFNEEEDFPWLYKTLIDSAYDNSLNLPEWARTKLFILINKNRYPLHYACYFGAVEQLEKEIKKGVRVDEQDTNGKTPLHYACERGHYQVVKALVEHGVESLDNVDNRGKTPYDYALQNGNINVIEYLKEKDAKPAKRFKPGNHCCHRCGKRIAKPYVL